VTDAHLVLGTLDAGHFLGGRMELDVGAARRALTRRVARPLGLGVEEGAAAVVRIADATMVRALRVISIARGHDPRRFALLAFGGAGPMHACGIAGELGTGRILVPRYPGLHSALGLLLSDVRYDLRRTWVERLVAVRPRRLASQLAALEREARELLGGAGFGDGRGRVDFALDMRYRGQAYELTVPLRSGAVDGEALRAAESAFHTAHRRTYGHSSPVDETEIVTVRARAVGRTRAPAWEEPDGGDSEGPVARRAMHIAGLGRRRVAVHERDLLRAGARIAGPAVVEQDDSTILVAPGWALRVGPAGSAVMERV
jgi:N-methylhydantoinase A